MRSLAAVKDDTIRLRKVELIRWLVNIYEDYAYIDKFRFYVHCSDTENQKIIIRMLASMQLQIREILQKLDRGKQHGISGNIEVIKSQVPLKSLAEINKFEERIHGNPEVATQFVSCLIILISQPE